MAAPIPTAPGWCGRLIAELGASDQRANHLLSGLSSQQLNWQPAPGAWGIGQCVEHLSVTNELYCAAIASALADQPVSAVEQITPGWFGRWFLRSFVEPSPHTKRARAPKKIVPASRVEASVLDRFLRSNQSVRELIGRAKDRDVNRIRFQNPFIPIIRFTVGTAFEIISGHERRHLLQAERVRQSAGFPA